MLHVKHIKSVLMSKLHSDHGNGRENEKPYGDKRKSAMSISRTASDWCIWIPCRLIDRMVDELIAPAQVPRSLVRKGLASPCGRTSGFPRAVGCESVHVTST